jgi:hypothetical protein
VAARIKYFIPAIAAAVLLAVPTANAGLLDPITQLVLPTCGSNSYPFSRFSDSHAYYGFANNGFESGSSGWSLAGGAYVGSGNEPWFVNGWGSRSLVLPPGASATSPSFCINLLDPAIRAFAKSAGASGNLQVQVVFHGLTGNLTGILNVGSLAPGNYSTWQPTDRVSSALALPLLTSYAQIRVTSTARSGNWQVDDAFVDPYICGVG